jgi:speckle-type POZ protein
MIRCDTVVVNGYKVHDAEKSVVLVPPSNLNQHLGGLLLTGKGADVVFEAGGETFAAHRCVLAARSPFFSGQLFGSMKMKEGSSSKDQVRIHGMEAQVFKALLGFLYTDSLPELTKEEEGAMCQHLLVATDMYGMERLKLICEDKLCRHIDVGTVANILALAEAHRCDVSACLVFLGRKANLIVVMASDGFQHLRASCLSVVKELLAMHSLT